MDATFKSEKLLLNSGIGLLNQSELFVMRILDYTRKELDWKELGLLGDEFV